MKMFYHGFEFFGMRFKEMLTSTRSAAFVVFAIRNCFLAVYAETNNLSRFPLMNSAFTTSNSSAAGSCSTVNTCNSYFPCFYSRYFILCYVAFSTIRSWFSFVGKKFTQWKKLFTRSAVLASGIKWLGMKLVMLAAGYKLKVARIIVPRASIFMMNLFPSCQWAANNSLHYYSMFKSLLTIDADDSVSERSKTSSSIGCAGFSNGTVQSESSIVHMAPASLFSGAIAESNFARLHGDDYYTSAPNLSSKRGVIWNYGFPSYN